MAGLIQLKRCHVNSGAVRPDKRSETIPSSSLSPDPSDSQLHDGASSLQFTSLIFYRVQVRGLEWL